MGTGIGKYCKRCGEQLNYDDGFEDGFCNRCYHIAKFETKKMSEKAFSKEEDENEHIKTHKKFLKLAEKQEEWKGGIQEALEKDFEKLYVKEYTTGWKEQRYLRNIEIGIMGFDNLERFISQLLEERTEEAKQEVIDDIWEEAKELAGWDEHEGVIPINQVENCLPEAIKSVEEKLSK